jgi:uncharacterized protein (TIGR02270 family)
MFASIDKDIAEEHARQASFLWTLRDRAVARAGYDLARLAELDQRLDAHLDGLRVAGDVAIPVCEELLAELEGGEMFTATFVALDRWDLEGLARLLDLGGDSPELAGAFSSALGFLPFERVQGLMPGLLSSELPPALLRLGIVAWAAHRRDPGEALATALTLGDPRLRARACRAAGELGRTDLVPAVQAAMRSDDEAAAFWAAWSAALLGVGKAAHALWDVATAGGRFAARAADLAVRRAAPGQALAWIEALGSVDTGVRTALLAAAALGDPALVPWLFERMRVSATARPAAHAFSMITGIDLVESKLDATPPPDLEVGPSDDPEDEDVAMDPDEDLPFPDVDGLAALWQKSRSALTPGARHLLGKPMSPASLAEVMRTGRQPARAGAALELSLRQPGHALFEVRAPANVQQAALGLRPSWGAP